MSVSAISSNSYIQNIAPISRQQTSGANVRNAFKDLAQALQSGDLPGAQQAFTTLQSHVKAHRGHHHHASGADPDKGAGSATGTSKSTGTNRAHFSSLLQQLAAGSGTGTNGVTDSRALLNAFLQQSGGTSAVAGGIGSSTNQSTFNIVI